MQIIKSLFQESKKLVFLSTLISLLSAISSTGLILMINETITGELAATLKNALLFVGLLLFTFLTGYGSQHALNVLSGKIVYELRMLLVARVLKTPLQQLEKLGGPKIYATFSSDVNAISAAYTFFPRVIFNFAIIIGGFSYLYYLSPVYLAFFLLALFFGIGGCQLILLKMEAVFALYREKEDSIFQHFNAMIEGAKELKQNNFRREKFYREEVDNTAGMLQKLGVKRFNLLALAGNISKLLTFGIAGVMIYIANLIYPQDLSVSTGYVMTILFLAGPIAEVMESVLLIINGNVSLKKINSLELEEIADWHTIDFSLPNPPKVDWKQLSLKNISYEYSNENEKDSFSLGPINMELKAGEIIFMVGGNGSGKSTLAKLITGLYPPQAGEIYLDKEKIDREKSEWFQNHFSSIFFDFFLFENLIGTDKEPASLEKANHYLKRLELHEKVFLEDGKLSTTQLSQGQRKRLALLAAYMEDRPLYLFDEWAADQDPVFRNFFYNEILPELKQRGKTVIVISHDDRYFHMADQLFKLEYGSIKKLDGYSIMPNNQEIPA